MKTHKKRFSISILSKITSWIFNNYAGTRLQTDVKTEKVIFITLGTFKSE